MPTPRRLRRISLSLVSAVIAGLALGVVAPPTSSVKASGIQTIDYAATLDGNSYFQAPDNAAFDITSNITIQMWIKPGSASCMTTTVYCMLLNKESAYEVAISNGMLDFAIANNAGGWNWRGTDVPVIQNVWQHIAFVFARSSNTLNLYYNGELAYSITNNTHVPATGFNSDGVLSIGTRQSLGEKYTGDIDEVRIYSGTRTQTQVRESMYTYGTVDSSNLVAYYDFNENSSTLVNHAPNAASGTNLTRTGTVAYTDLKTVTNPAGTPNRTVVTFARSYITNSGGWTVPSGVTRVDALVVAGGGGGGGGMDDTGWSGGGGGGGGLQTLSNGTVTPGTAMTVAVGGGGLRGLINVNSPEADATSGAASIFGSTTAIGGGAGGANSRPAGNGGSGGGAGTYNGASTRGTGTSGQGNNGGVGKADCCAGGGGGGAGGAGGAGTGASGAGVGGAAGAGVSSSISGSAVFYAAGGAGNGYTTAGAAGSSGGNAVGVSGTAGTGSGGGGGGGRGAVTWTNAGFGGSGVVIVSYGSTVAVGSTDNSRLFNGTSTSNVTVNDNNLIDLGLDFTAEAWIYPTATACDAHKVFIGKENSFLFAMCNNSISYAIMGTGGTWNWTTTSMSVSLNSWQHFAFVRSGGRLTIYKNGGTAAGGTEVTSTSLVPTTVLNNSSNNLMLGVREGSSVQSYTGYMDDFRLWSYARTASAIALNYDKHIAGDLIYFPFDESGGPVVYNHAPAIASTLNGTATSTATIQAAWPTSTMTYVAGNVYGVLPGYDFQTGGAVTFAIAQNGTKGTATVSASTGAFSYVANPGATGNDSFTYSVTGANGSATYSFTVNAPTQPMTSAKTFRQTADITATLNTASSLGYNNPATAYTLGETIRATVSATNGVINLTQGSTTIAAGAQNSSTITIDGSQSAVNAALNSATVTATSPIPTRVTLDISMKPGDQVVNGRTYTWNSNGHYYTRIIPANNGYVAAQSDAQSMSLGGRPGYLATIQHSGENATVSGINGTNSWLGGSDRDLQGTYRWKGNDTNSIFRQGGSSFRNRYNNFASGEPNGENGSEDWVEMRSDGLWNDCQDSCNRSSAIIEFDPVSSRTITEVDFQRSLAATAQSARSLGLGTSFLNTATWANGEIVRITLTASAGTVAYTAGSTTLVSGASGTSTVTFEGSVANVNTALNTTTVTPSASGNSTVALTYGVKRVTTGNYIYNATTDHFYLADTTGRNYANTKSTVEARTWAGTNGYMVTVTSEAEHNTVKTLTSSPTWSGGSDATSEGQWEWNSPDAFQIYSDFEVGLAGSVSYFDPTGEPNNSGNFMVVNFGTSKMHWDDTGDTTYQSITEFSPIDTTLTFNITATSALSITAPSTGLAATNGTAYSLSISATGGQTPYTYALASGSLPTGLSLNTSTGTIAGTTSGPSTTNAITIRATDANDATATTATFTLTSTPLMCTTSTTVVGRWTVEQVTSGGSCLWTVPAGVTAIDAFVVGAGGGGGADGGGGGGGGASQVIAGVAVTAGENLTATIGAGGAGATFGGGVSTAGTSSSIARSGTTLASANGGSPGSTGPGAAVGAGGTSTLGFAGGAGGAGSAAVGAGSAGKTGASNYFLGMETQYGGGGGGGSYNNGSNSFAIPAGASGGGAGCGSPTASTNTVGVSGVRGGGGGGGCAGNAGRTAAGSGGDGVVIIRYATDPLDAFPASVGTPAYRYIAENFQTLDSTRKQWIDASGNGRHSASVSGSPLIQSITGNGSSTSIRTLSGGIADGIRFASFSPTTTNAYTLFQVTRYSGTTRKRILDGSSTNWLSGYWQGSVGVAWHGNWLTSSSNSGTNMLNWNLMTDQNQLFRHNGVNKVTTSTTQNFDTQLAINAGYYGIGGGGLASFDERSDFNAAEIILFNGNLTATQIRQVENYLARIYGLRGFDFNNVDKGANSVGSLTASRVGTMSTGNSTQLALTWTAPQDTTGVTGYKVEYKKTSDSAWTTFVASTASTSSTITGLEAGTAYDTRVTPVDTGATNRPDTTASQTTWAESSITLSSVPANPKTNTNNILRATVTGAASGTTGTVNFMVDGTTITGCGTTSVIGGEASCTWSPTSIGTYNITATFSGDADNLQATTATASSVTVTYAECLTSTTTSGRFTVERITTVGGCEYSSFPSGVESVDVLVVGGGGGGGENVGAGGSGGGGYYAERVSATSASTLTVIVGAGGRGGASTQASTVADTLRDGGNGESSSVVWGANTFTGAGGIGGQTHWADNKCGGTGWTNTNTTASTGTGTDGTALTSGVGGRDGSAINVNATAGGAGYTNSITGTSTPYGGGGGGGAWGSGLPGTGGSGGGGSGSSSGVGTAGTANTGGGGGGGAAGCVAGGAGGSGVVILRYANVPTITTQPAAVTKASGQSHTFSVTPSATGAVSGDFTYQWRKDGVNIVGATSSTYTINSLNTTSAGDYSVVVKSTGASGAVSAVTSSDATLTMTKGSQTITFGSLADRVYGVADFTISSSNSASLQNTFTSNSTSVCTVASPTFSAGTTSATVSVIDVGTCSITASQAGDVDYNAATDVTQTFVIATKSLTISGMTAANKEYDATVSATPSFTNAALVGVVSGDTVSFDSAGATATFANKNVGNGKTVTASGVVLSGTHAARYSLTQPTATANITAKELTVTGITANNRVYDRTTSATALLNKGSAALSGVISGDTVILSTASATATFANKTVENGKTVTIAGLTIAGTDAANYSLTQPTTTANITAKSLTVTGITANNRVYDGTDTATAQLVTGSAALSGVISGDSVTLSTSGVSATFDDKTVASGKTVTIAGLTISGTDSANYSLTQPTTTASVTAKELTVTGITANNRVYDATNSATALLNKGSAALSGVISGDTVTLSTASATATFANKTVESGKTVTIAGLTISGTDATNYSLTQPTATASITAKELTVSGVTANNKTYDQGTSAALNLGSAAFVGVISGDTVTISTGGATGTFSSKNVGTNKAVTIAGITKSGADAANYTITQPSTTANITAKTLTVSGITASNRGYDGTTTATINSSSAAFVGVISGDDVSINTSGATGAFSDANIGDGKTVQISGVTATGADAANYSITQPTTTADISAKTLTVTGITSTSRVYNGSTSATNNLNTSNASLVGIENNDSITLVTSGISGTFDNKNVGTNKTITITGLTINGTNAGNYTLVQPTLTTGRITTKQLTVTGITANNKVYDGNTSATSLLNKGSAALSGLISGDQVTLSTANATATFVDRFVGNSKAVTIAGITISGTDAHNYQLIQPQTTANVTPKELTVTGIVGVNRVYNGSTNADGDLNDSGATLVGVVGADDVVLDTQSMTGTFDNKNVGTNKTITIADLSIYGNDISNYTLTQPTATANITAKTLTVSGITANNRVYNGSDSATALLNKGSAALVGVVNGDTVTLSTSGATATFANKNVANNKTVTVAGLTISGADAPNYTLTQPATTASILAKELTVSGITANNRVYNGSDSATALLNKGSAALVGVVNGDTVTLSTSGATATFANKTVANNKQVTIAGLTISGTDAANYTLTQPTTTANITAKELTVSGVTATTKIYDGNTTATLTTSSATLVGVVSGDTVNLDTTNASGSFATNLVEAGKVVTVSGLAITGTDAGNYTLTQPTTTADILSASAGLAWSAPSNIVYGTLLSSTQLNATASVAGQFTYNPPSGTKLTAGTHTLSVTFVPTNVAYDSETTTVSITVSAKTLTVSGITANNRTYDATNSATNQLVTGSAALVGVVSGDDITLSTSNATGTFADKTVANGKTITIAGLTISGNDTANYTLTQPTTTASILTKELTVSGITANNRTYDATNSATALLNKGSAALVGVVNGDTVTLSTSGATATFTNKDIGTNKTVFVADVSISGTDAANYSLTQPTTTASILAKELIVSGITANNRVYNGSDSATALLNKGSAALVGVVNGDTVTLSTSGATATFTNKDIGTNKTVFVADVSISGTDAANYSLTQPTTTASILAKELIVSGITANNRVYNGSDSATALLNKGSAALVGVVNGDTVTLSTSGATATFANKNVANNKTVTVAGLTISGTDANNYALTQPTTTANITTKTLTVSGITANNRTYDATTDATNQLVTGSAALVGVVSGDDITLSTSGATGTFADKTVANGKTITIAGLTISGTDATNYILTQPTATANITTATLTVTGITTTSRAFNGTTSATALVNANTATLVGIIGGDNVTPNFGSLSAVFADANVGVNKSVTISGISLTGTDATNYTLTQPTTTATITQATSTLTWSNPSDITFGTSLSSTQLNASAGVAGTFVYAPVSGTRLDAGTHTLSVTFTPISGNYATETTTVSITVLQKPVTVTADNESIVYGASPQSTFAITGLATGDAANAVTFTYAGTGGTSYASSTTAPVNAGTYSITPSALTLTTGQTANYAITYQPGALTIAKASQQTVTAVPASTTVTYAPAPNKTTVSLSSSGGSGDGAVTYTVTGGDPCTIAGTTLTVEGAGSCSITATKATSANYLSRASAPVVITINKASQTLTLDAITTKTYGDATFSAVTTATSGLAVTISASPSSVCDVPSALTIRIVSTGTCTVTATQAGDSNWLAATTAAGSSSTRSFVVDPKVLTVLGTAASNRMYDGTTDATALVNFASATLSGVVSGDVVSLNSSNVVASFTSKNIGSSKPITISGLSLSGTHAHRYVVEAPINVAANVTVRTLSVTGITVPSRVYNGTTTATLNTSAYAFTGVANGDSVTLNDASYSASFASANASNSAQLVTVTGLQIAGNDASNYVLTQPVLQGFITKAAANIVFGPTLSTPYTGSPLSIATATQPVGLSLLSTYSGTNATTYGPSSSAPTNAGSYSVSASVNDINYEGTQTSSWTITKAVVTLQMASGSLSYTFNGMPKAPTVNASLSGRTISLSYTGTNGTSYQSTWPPTNAGTYAVTATVVDANYQGTLTETLTINKATQSPITLTNASTVRFGNTLQLVAVGGSSSGDMSYAVTSGACSVNSVTGVITPNNVGLCSVTATRAESMNYVATTSTPQSITVTPGIQTLAFSSFVPSMPVVNTTYDPTAMSTSGLTPTLTVTTGSGSVCNMVGGTITFVASGLCVITASQAGDSRWQTAANITQTIEVGKLSQAITFPQPALVSLGAPDFTLEAYSSSGLPLSYAVTQGTACSITSSGIVSILSVGTCTIEASQAGNSRFALASSVARTITVVTSLPTSPFISSVSSGDGTVTVAFSAPHSNGGSPILAYELVAESNSAPTVTRNDCSAQTLSCTLIGLVNGASYAISVAAVNARGTGPASDTAEVLIPLPTLSAARNIVGTRQNTSMTVSWDDPNSYGAGTFVHYQVYLKQRGGTFGAPVTVQSADRVVRSLSTPTRSAQFTQLDPSQLYESKIVTITSTASAEASDNTATALILPLGVPSVPRNLVVESPTGTSARISWGSPLQDGGSALQNYSVTTSAGTCTLATPLSTSCSVSNLQRGSALSVSVRAHNNVGQSIAATTQATLSNVPGAPTLGVLTPTSTSATVAWSAPASNGGRMVTSYIVDVFEVGQPAQQFQCTSSGLSCVIHNLKSSTQYSFSVSAVNSVGQGATSSAVTLSTLRPTSTEWDSFRNTTPLALSTTLSLPPAPARVTSQRVGSRRTQVTAIRRAADANIPVTYALISVSTRTNKLLARIKVLVDPNNPTTTVSVPYASSRIKVAVQFANSIGLSPGGPAGLNISEGNTFEWTTVAGTVDLVGEDIPGSITFAKGSSQLTYTTQKTLKKMAAAAKKRGGLVYITGFAQKGERRSAWMLEPLARARAEAVAKYLSRQGVRQWITFQGTTARTNTGWKPTNQRRVVVTTVSPTAISPTVS